ncbi:beta-1,6-N-acetylglucosaminyltransferase [Clostridium beijerinckii]|uniref:beta-1,6-N-acetylglucosaminyltransferase n=1 Tax=Clostridium beijerinckii TaxID=1520 RepID=UPI0004794298|nr:beta-1,6-N-acetylglucosaminyltransferase [Clostridium beijerinckii]
MKIAYCIICHKYTKILKQTVDLLFNNNDIYIHVDLKSNIKEFFAIKDKVTFIDERIDVKWGSFSQVEATINLLENTKHKRYDYIFLLSGDCLPLRSDSKIKETLTNNKNKEYVALDIHFSQEEINKRVKKLYSNVYYSKNNNFINRIIKKIIYKYLPENELLDRLPKLYKGTNWFGITEELRNYILEYIDVNKWYIDAFKQSFCCDEVFFHTIIFNSKYKENIYQANDKSNICFQALRYIDWKTGPDYPRTLDETDFKKMKESECLFARKFNNKLDINYYINEFIL